MVGIQIFSPLFYGFKIYSLKKVNKKGTPHFQTAE